MSSGCSKPDPIKASTAPTKKPEPIPPIKETPTEDKEMLHNRLVEKQRTLLEAFLKEYASDQLRLVGKNHSLPENYEVKELVPQRDLPSLKTEILMRQVVYDCLVKLYEDSAKDKITDLALTSGYRSLDYQIGLFNRQVKKYLQQHSVEKANELASQAVAIPGTSEHHLGYTIDFISTTNYKLTDDFATTPGGQWVLENAWKYGFMLSFPENTQSITGIIYEPWHYRYVGAPHADYIHEKGYCLDQYLNELKENEITLYETKDGQRYKMIYITHVEELAEEILLQIPLDKQEELQVSLTKDNAYLVTIPLN